MSRRRAEKAPLGFTSNGLLLVNVLTQLSKEHARALKKALPPDFGGDWFIGVAVDQTRSAAALARLEDAAAEAASRLVASELKVARARKRSPQR